MMTESEKKQRRISHVVVDLLDMIGGGMVADAMYRRSWIFGIAGLVVIAGALWTDRRNTLREE